MTNDKKVGLIILLYSILGCLFGISKPNWVVSVFAVLSGLAVGPLSRWATSTTTPNRWAAFEKFALDGPDREWVAMLFWPQFLAEMLYLCLYPLHKRGWI